jgi:hypothetical protein
VDKSRESNRARLSVSKPSRTAGAGTVSTGSDFFLGYNPMSKVTMRKDGCSPFLWPPSVNMGEILLWVVSCRSACLPPPKYGRHPRVEELLLLEEGGICGSGNKKPGYTLSLYPQRVKHICILWRGTSQPTAAAHYSNGRQRGMEVHLEALAVIPLGLHISTAPA